MSKRTLKYEMVDVAFQDVTLGAVFFDPESGMRMQKVDEPIENMDGLVNHYRNKFNAIGGTTGKNFTPNDKVKIAKFL